MEQEHSLRGRSDGRLEVSGVEVQVVGTDDVAEDGRRARVPDGVRRGDEVERRQDDLVARPAAGGEERQVQGGSAVCDRKGVCRVGQLGEGRLELPDPRAHAPPTRVDDLVDEGTELVVDEHVDQGHDPSRARSCL